METPRITLRQTFWLFVCSRFVITLVFIPQFSESSSNRDVIPILFMLGPMAALFSLPFVLLWSQYPNQTLIEYSRSLLGRWIGKAVGILYIWYFIHQASITLRVFIEFLATRFFINTPVGVIGFGILLIATYVVYMGLEVLGRCADVLVPLIFLGILVFVALSISNAHWQNVIPTWKAGTVRMMLEGIPSTTRWNEFAWMAMIIPFIANKQKIKQVIYGGILFNSVFWIILCSSIVAIFGPELVRNAQFPTLELVQIISIGNFLERIDALALGLWVFGSFIKISIFYYVAVLGASQWFGLKERNTLTFPIGLIIFILSLSLFSSIVDLKHFNKAMVPYNIVFVFVIPLLLLVIHYIKKRTETR